MNGRVDVLLHYLLRDHDCVFVVVAVPGHERDQHVAAEREFAVVRIGTIGNDLAFLHVLAFVDDRLLIDARPRIRAHEFPQLINVDPFLHVGL